MTIPSTQNAIETTAQKMFETESKMYQDLHAAVNHADYMGRYCSERGYNSFATIFKELAKRLRTTRDFSFHVVNRENLELPSTRTPVLEKYQAAVTDSLEVYARVKKELDRDRAVFERGDMNRGLPVLARDSANEIDRTTNFIRTRAKNIAKGMLELSAYAGAHDEAVNNQILARSGLGPASSQSSIVTSLGQSMEPPGNWIS